MDTFDKTISDFAKRLSNIREVDAEFDKSIGVNPELHGSYINELEKGDPSAIAEIEKHWKLPSKYLKFLKDYSPKDIHLIGVDFMNDLNLYGASELIEKQIGYAWDEDHQIFEEWPENLVVIGDDGADPYCLDLDAIENGDAPILRALHGEGTWDFEQYADSFEHFLHKLTNMKHFEEDDLDEGEEDPSLRYGIIPTRKIW